MQKKKGNNARDRMLREQYNVSELNYLAMAKEQNNVCFICLQPEKAREFLAVDHCHSTGRVRGLLCADCNRALGQFHDDVEILARAITYLQRDYTAPAPEEPTPYIPHTNRRLWRVLITTPDGVFASEQDAARHYGVHASTIRSRTKNLDGWTRSEKIQMSHKELTEKGIMIVPPM